MSDAASTAAADPAFEELLAFIRDQRGFDFTGYKRATLLRRVSRRMQSLGMDDFELYQHRLEADGAEFAALFDTILINVTSFFRDAEVWAAVRDDVIPELLQTVGPGAPLRVWSAGCAAGHEPYSLAMLLCDAMGESAFRDRVKIYATDVDTQALADARRATYPRSQVEGVVPPALVKDYLEETTEGLHYTVRKDLRRVVVFGRHDLLQDPPISRIDLLTCRNTMMYFGADTQRQVLAKLYYALQPWGSLVMGKCEVLVTRTHLFETRDLKNRIVAKVANQQRPTSPERPPRPAAPVDDGSASSIAEAGFEASPVPQLVVDTSGLLAAANQHARELFGIGATQIGRPFRDLELSYRPLELRSRIDEVRDQRRILQITDVAIPATTSGEEPKSFDVQVAPLLSGTGHFVGVVVSFLEVTRFRHLEGQLHQLQRELETAYEELQSTNEELETTNEELQSTNEELETTNEELQSTNEELETRNAELQSTNDELGGTNDELRLRTDQLHVANGFLESVFRSLDVGIVVVNEENVVQVWNRECEDLWGVRAEEATGQHLMNLDIGLPVEQLRAPLRAAAAPDADVQHVAVEALNRRGRTFSCQVTVTPLRRPGGESVGAILLMEAQRPTA